MKAKASVPDIKSYLHCRHCLEEIPEDQSPATWARLNVGWTKKGLQVWCDRHNQNVLNLDFLGQKVTPI